MEQISESKWKEIFEKQEKDSKRNVDIMRKSEIPIYIRYQKKFAAKKKDFSEFKREEVLPLPNGLIIEVSW